ncbi:MAG: YfaZ family protein [Thiovulaceae bacterium]|nr:YfaZ family protein [Sulfurimonadaceae bacterium]
MLKRLLIGLLLTGSVSYAMHEFELNLNNKDLDLHLGLDMGQFNDTIEPDSFLIKARVMKGDRDHARLPYDQDTAILTELGFVVQSTETFARGLRLGMGVKLAYTPLDNQSIFAMPIGAVADYTLPLDIAIPLHIGGQFYYAPEVLSFEKSTSYMEYQANFDIHLMERGFITTGYRVIKTPTKDRSSAYYNHSYFVGMRFLF